MTFHSEPDEATVTELMTKYGIARVPTAEFHYKTYRYARLEDALVQARRDAARRDAPAAADRWKVWPHA